MSNSKFEFKQINKIEVKPVVSKDFSKRKVKGKAYYAEPFANIALIARKKSGKSTVIYETVENCASTKTVVYIFASTVEKDDTYKELLKMLDEREITYHTFMSIKEDGVDQLKGIIDELKKTNGAIPEMEGSDDDGEPKPDGCLTGENGLLPIVCSAEERVVQKKKEVKKKDAKKKATKLYPKYMFIFDDLSTELKNKYVDFLLKMNRHIQAKVLISTQWLNDLLPSSRRQMDYYILFKGLTPEKLEAVYKDADLHVDYETFVEVYEAATVKKYSFLYIDVGGATFRQNFNTEITL